MGWARNSAPGGDLTRVASARVEAAGAGGPAPRAGRSRRLLALLLAGTAAFGLFAASCEGPSYTCEGRAWKTCSMLPADQCAATDGCELRETPRCVEGGVTCDGEGAGCDRSFCVLKEGTCATICGAEADEGACSKRSSTCVWADDRCTTDCELLDAAADCQAAAHCKWLTCRGQPRPCEEFSGDRCPTWLGCDKIKHFAYSAQ